MGSLGCLGLTQGPAIRRILGLFFGHILWTLVFSHGYGQVFVCKANNDSKKVCFFLPFFAAKKENIYLQRFVCKSESNIYIIWLKYSVKAFQRVQDDTFLQE